MRSVIQRVSRASVWIDGVEKSRIGKGILVLLGIEDQDTGQDVEWLVGKISRLRIFNDSEGVMNLSVLDVEGEVLVISQFTLFGNVRKGNRPSYNRASKPEKAVPLYEAFLQRMQQATGKPPGAGEFGARMEVCLVNDGPVTILIDTKDPD
jgi:D-tyrosyl-tRNA(Tyr) deacylase